MSWLNPDIRPLTDPELALARSVFRETIPYRLVFIANDLGLGGAPWTESTLGGYRIHFGQMGYDNAASMATMPGFGLIRDIFIHEMTHVWQGAHSSFHEGYMIRSTASQFWAWATNSDAYEYTPARPGMIIMSNSRPISSKTGSATGCRPPTPATRTSRIQSAVNPTGVPVKDGGWTGKQRGKTGNGGRRVAQQRAERSCGLSPGPAAPCRLTNPCRRGDSSMSTLTFNRHDHSITLFNSKGQRLGSWEAYNNVTTTSNGIWPNGTYKYSHYNEHAGLGVDSAYGTQGIFVFTVSGRTGMGVHAGRQNVQDGKGRTGPAYNTLGCIRTTEDAVTTIRQTHEGGDALTDILVVDGSKGDFPRAAAVYV